MSRDKKMRKRGSFSEVDGRRVVADCVERRSTLSVPAPQFPELPRFPSFWAAVPF